MESLTTLAVSLSVIVALNLLVAFLVWSEYLDHRIRFLKYVALAQFFITVWHLLSAVLVNYPAFSPALVLSLTTFTLAVYYYLAAATYRQVEKEAPVHRLGACLAASVALLGLLSATLTNLFWIINGLLLIAMPIVTLVYFRQISRRLIALFQVVIVTMFLSSAVFFDFGYPVAGGLFYVLLGLFQPILSVMFMISSIRLNRRDIVAREHDYRVFFESVNEVFFKITGSGHILEISPSIAQFGFAPEQVRGRRLADYLDEPEEFLLKLNPVFNGSKPILYKGEFLTPRKPVDCEIMCSRIENSETGEFHFAGSIRNTHERNMLERQFLEAQRHEYLGTLAGGMAHDFNNLLQGIIGYTEILLEARDLDSESKSRGLNAILRAATTAGDLCKQLMQYSGKGIKSGNTFNLAKEISEVVELSAHSCPEGVNINLTLPDTAPYMQGDSGQITQVVLNLLRNALDAMAERGEVDITLTESYLDDADLRTRGLAASLVPGNYHVLEFRDNGPGIEPAVQSRIFDPFFSTKKNGRGLGLSAVTGILKIHQGGITMESTPGKGSVFRVFLPASGSGLAEGRQERRNAARRGMLVLLVEDDMTVREVAASMLQRAGYRVLEASDGIDALRMMGLASEQIDLVVTDIKMPNMDGIELAHKLAEQLPDLPIVLISGYADVSETLVRAQPLTFQFVAKPFRGDELVNAVAKAAEQIRLRSWEPVVPAMEEPGKKAINS